jgi:hypothetical protein
MSLYDLTKNISNVVKTNHMKHYTDDYVVAKFIKNNKSINLYYKNYSKKLLKDHMSRDYDQRYVNMDFWDPSFCSYKNISDEDIKSLDRLDAEVDNRVATSYVMASISLHEIILKSYIDDKYDIIKDSQSFDKNTVRQMLCDFDMVIEFNNQLTNFINNVFDDNSMSYFMITPSGKFRFMLGDVRYFLMGTKNVHDISSAIVDTMTDVPTILNYHLELLNVCDVIYSPDLITSYKANNILLNLLKLDINLDIYEKRLFRTIDKYIDKEGVLDMVFDLQDNRFENIIPTLDSIREYRLSSYSRMF